jgi:glycosyltransferase involved in cell wall biosynthesis
MLQEFVPMQKPRVAYLTSRFPKLTETFILYEILELERQGVAVEIFPLVRERAATMHAEAAALAARAFDGPPFAPQTALAQVAWLGRNPQTYLSAWRDAVQGNLGSPKFLLRALAVVPQAALFAQECLRRGVQHVHAHWATHPTLAAYVINRLTGIPFSFTAHAHDIYVERAMLEEKIRAASFVVTISDYNRRLLAELYGPAAAAKIQVIHCGVDLRVFTPPAAAPDGPLTMLCVGSLQEKKGQRYLIEACGALARAGRDVRCLLVGEGETRSALEALIAQHGLSGRVQLLGAQPRDRVQALLAEAHLAVLPSISTSSGRQEGIPVALMEAMAMGLPVVATRISGVPELVEHEVNGLLVSDRDVPALAAAIARLADDPALRERFGAAGRATVERAFELRRCAAELRALLLRPWGAASSAQLATEQAV